MLTLNSPQQSQIPYDESRAAFHSLIANRIYHEDNLFAQRWYVLLAVHAFMMNAFVLLLTVPTELRWSISLFLAFLGSVLGIFQASFGRQTNRAIGFWRAYIKLIEKRWGIPFDYLQYDFFLNGKVETPFGVIDKKRRSQKPDNQNALYQMYKKTKFFTHSTKVIGILFPLAFALFWTLAFAYCLYKVTGNVLLSGLAVLAFLVLTYLALPPGLAEADDRLANEANAQGQQHPSPKGGS